MDALVTGTMGVKRASRENTDIPMEARKGLLTCPCGPPENACMEKAFTRTIWGELLHHGKVVHKVEMRIVWKESYPDGGATCAKRWVISEGAQPVQIEDGDDYRLRYTFFGEVVEVERRVKNGTILIGAAGKH